MGICKAQFFSSLSICHEADLSRPDNMITLLCDSDKAKLWSKNLGQAQTEAAKPSSGFCSISDTAVTKYAFIIICGPGTLSGETSA